MASPGNCGHLTVPGVQGYVGKIKDGKLKRGLVMKSLDTCQLKGAVFRSICRLSTRKQALIWGAGGFLGVLRWGRGRCSSSTGATDIELPLDAGCPWGGDVTSGQAALFGEELLEMVQL